MVQALSVGSGEYKLDFYFGSLFTKSRFQKCLADRSPSSYYTSLPPEGPIFLQGNLEAFAKNTKKPHYLQVSVLTVMFKVS